jgi:transposase-like protein
MSSSRRRFTPEQKAQVVRRHLANKESVSALAQEFGLQPSQIHLWCQRAPQNRPLRGAQKPARGLL